MSAVCRVITGVSGSPRNLPALRYATALARGHAATLIPVLAWAPPGGEGVDRRYPSSYLRREWERDARGGCTTPSAQRLAAYPPT